MTDFLTALTSYPTLIYTVLLGVVLFYWILAVIGIVDIDSGGFDIDTDLQVDIDIDDLGDVSTLAGYLVALGLNGVPFSVVVSLIALVSWVLSCLAGMWLLPLVPTAVLGWIAGTVVLLLSFAISLPVTARAIRPLRKLFVTHNAISNHALVGQVCQVLTGTVDEKFGRAEVSTRGTGININVWAETPNNLSKGTPARILEYDSVRERYLIVAEPEDNEV